MSVRATTLAWLGLPLLACLVYAPALHNPFVYDDLVAIKDNALIRQLHLAPLFLRGGVSTDGFANGQFRPLTVLTFALNYRVGGVDPFGYRLVNLVLHMANALLGALLVRGLLARVPLVVRKPPLSRESATVVALLAMAWFVVHPINSLAILLAWKRATLLFSLFSLIAILCLLALRSSHSDNPWRRRGLLAGLWASQLLAVASKENAAVLPLVILLVELWPTADAQPRRRPRDALVVLVPTFAVGIASAAFLLTRATQQVEIGPFAYLATQTKVVWSYLAMWVVPTLVSTVYDVVPGNTADVMTWGAGLATAGALVLIVWSARRWPFVSLASAWVVLWLAPTSSLVPIPLLEDEDRTYLAFLLLWALPAAALAWLADRPRARVPARVGTGLILVALTGLTLSRVTLWSDAEVLWRDAIKHHPRSHIAATNYCAAVLAQPDKAKQAVAVCSDMHARAPGSGKLQGMLVAAYRNAGAAERAEQLLARFLEDDEPGPEVLRTAGHSAWFHDRPREAIAYYRRALALHPFDFESVLYMARSYVELGELDHARSLATQLDRWSLPDNLHFSLALAELHRAVGWQARACAEVGAMRPRLDASFASNVDLRNLRAACELPVP